MPEDAGGSALGGGVLGGGGAGGGGVAVPDDSAGWGEEESPGSGGDAAEVLESDGSGEGAGVSGVVIS